MVGCEEHEVSNTPEEWLDRIHPDDLKQVQLEIEAHLAEGPCQFDIHHRMLHKNGTYRWMSCHGVVMRSECGQAVRMVGSHSDITAEKVADVVTGLPNGLLFLDRLTRSVERAKRHQDFHFAVLLLELDRPESLRTHPGPAAGNPLLIAAARRLETCLRAGDTPASLGRDYVLARPGGDQFALLLDRLNEVGEAKIVAERVLAEISVPFALDGHEVFLSASIGIAVSVTGYTRPEDVLRDADTALYRAKALGKARCEVFDTAILESAQARLQLESDLEEALERQEFSIFYQPIVSLTSNQIAGFEALVRWQHPIRGMIPPLEFIPIAERTGFIVPLGNWILREACLQLKAWQESLAISKELWISVNLSSLQFMQPTLLEQIGEALRDVALDAHCLMLELTEGVLMENPTAASGMLMQLRVMGAKIGLDDFGTGHSSLSYLHQFPADFLKIDRSFVLGIETRRDKMEIVRSITGLADQLGLHVIAEGIENEEQLALIRSLNCEYVQGFLFSKPVNCEKAAEMLRTGLPQQPVSRSEEKPALRKNESLAGTGPSLIAHRLSIAPGLHPEGGLPEAQERRGLPWKSSTLYIVSAALTLLMATGLVARFNLGIRPPSPSASKPALQNAAQERPVETTNGPEAQCLLPDAVPLKSAPTAAKSSGVEPKEGVPAESNTRNLARATSGNNATRESGRSGTSTRNSAPPAHEPLAFSLPAAPPGASTRNPAPPANEPLTYSLPVVHQHVLGGCRGILIVSQEGVSFVPDKDKDAFSLKYDELLCALSGDNLTIKSDAKTYRFKAANVTGKDENRAQLKKVIESIARFRRNGDSH